MNIFLTYALLHVWLVVLFVCGYEFTLDEEGRPNRECLLTQHGKDGFGHQLEGKMSCRLLGVLAPRFAYLHTPFVQFEHGHLDSKVVEEFTNAGADLLQWAHLKDSKKYKIESLNDKALAAWWKRILSGGKCESDVIYSLDNCWDVLYRPPYVTMMGNATQIDLFRSSYLSTPKPATGFESGKINIVVHIRRFDGYDDSASYFERGIKYLNDTHTSSSSSLPIFWIESDDPSWPFIVDLKKNHPTQVREPSASDSIFVSFHRFVMADGFIMSHSSLSFAASYFRKQGMVISNHSCVGLRYDLTHTERWTRLATEK